MVRLITAPVGAQSTGSRYCLGSKPFEGCLLLVRIPIETAPALTTVNPVLSIIFLLLITFPLPLPLELQ